MFRSYREPDGIRFDAMIQQFFLGQLGMGSGCRVDHQTFHISHICQQGKYLKAIYKLPGFLLPSLYLKSEDGCSAVRKVFLIQSMIGMFLKRGMVYLVHLRIDVEEFNHLLCVLHVTFQPEGQCLNALKQQKRIER